MSNNYKLDRYLGSLLAAVIGDALGWPNENRGSTIQKNNDSVLKQFKKWVKKSGGRYWLHEEEICAGDYSDDSQLLFATARSLDYGNDWYRQFTKVELPSWSEYERGGGRATKTAVECWKKGLPPWRRDSVLTKEVKQYFEAGGNGVVMRILPHVLFNINNVEECLKQVFLNGICTHGHPRAILGAMIYAYSLNKLLSYDTNNTLSYGEIIDVLIEDTSEWSKFPNVNRIEEWIESAQFIYNGNYFNVWDDTVKEIIVLLKTAQTGLKQGVLDTKYGTLEKMKCFDDKVKGAGTISAVVAIYIASKYASNPTLGLIEAANLNNADTDTLASLVGGFLGLLHGTDWLSLDWFNVQDSEYISRIAQNLIKKNSSSMLTSTKVNLIKNKKELKVNDKTSFGPFNSLVVTDKVIHKAISKNISVYSIKLVSDEGQTIYIKVFEKKQTKGTALRVVDLEEPIVRLEDNTIKTTFSILDLEHLSDLFESSINAKQAIRFISSILKIIYEKNMRELTEANVAYIKKRINNLEGARVEDIITILISLSSRYRNLD